MSLKAREGGGWTTGGFKTGVLISLTSNAIIANNSFIDFPIGDTAHNEVIQVYRSDNNLILNNYINSSNNGIILFASSNNTLKGNRVLSSGRGIALYYSSSDNIVENNILINNSVNIILDNAQNNTIRMNSFSTHERQGYDDSDNLWSHNYWSDYTGRDDDGDGIGDTPYAIHPKGLDHTPLMSFLLAPVSVPPLKPVPFEDVWEGEWGRI
jgi:parallel beta-helix repeat protein